MIITIDGYDGTGKTTLAKRLAEKYKFEYLDKPFIKMIHVENNCSYEEAVRIAEARERELYAHATREDKVRFYCNAFLWLKNYEDEHNIFLDRGILTTYAVFGDSETEAVFDYFVDNGGFFNLSLYLVAADEERVRRIFENDPNDPDLKHPVKWRINNLEEYAVSRNLKFYKIDTNGRTPDQVYEEAVKILDKLFASE